MRGDVTYKILESLTAAAIGMAELFVVIADSGYGASYGKLSYNLQNRGVSNNKEEENMRRKRYTRMIHKLKKDGLIKERLSGQKKILILTRKGLDKLKILKEKPKSPPSSFRKEIGDRLVIITFDIPEVERRKRGWLRRSLVSLGFNMVQKSVWIGKIKIPKDFLNALFELKINEFVEIFEITKSGSLKNIN